MNTKPSWLIVALIVFLSALLIDTQASYAQTEEDVVARQVFTVRAPTVARHAGNRSTQTCEVTAELRWYKKKLVRVLYHWQACTGAYPIRWALASVRNASGTFMIKDTAGELGVYKETWTELATGDQLTLHTWIDDVPQADVVTEYREASPIWTKIHTRQEAGGACFQFTGHIDPWGVFTAGDHKYVFELSTDDWTTPWVAGPNQPTVDWHVQFYKDAALTQLRTEYWFNNVPNPCYSEPPACDSIVLSIPNGASLPEDGAAVAVTIKGQHGSPYRIVDQQGTVVAGPDPAPTFTFHAMPNVGYQAQVYGEGYGWTSAGCQFQYNLIARPICHGVMVEPAANSVIPVSGQTVQVTINGEHGSQYQIVDAQGTVVAGPDTNHALAFHAMPHVVYQAQVYNATYGWTTSGCTFQYIPAAVISCDAVELSIPNRSVIAEDGAEVQVTIKAEGAVQYRIVNQDSGGVVANPSPDATFTLDAKPLVHYQGQVLDAEGNWTKVGCEFTYFKKPPVEEPFCEAIALSIANGSALPAEGAEVVVTVSGVNATQYRLVDAAGKIMVEPSPNNVLTFHAMPAIVYQAQVANADYGWTNEGCQFGYNQIVAPVCQGIDLTKLADAVSATDGGEVEVTIRAENATQYQIVRRDTGAVVAGPDTTNILRFYILPEIGYQAEVANADSGWLTGPGCSVIVKPPVIPVCKRVDLSIPTDAVLPAAGAEVDVAIKADNANRYQIVDSQGTVVSHGTAHTLRLHAMPHTRYQAQVANNEHDWTTNGCDFGYRVETAVQVFCELTAEHYGDPGGLSKIKAWVVGQTAPVAIEKIKVNWDNQGSVIYPTKRQPGPWFTSTPFVLDSRPEVHDVGFGPYKFEAWVYVAGIDAPAYCWDTGNAPDHDNLLPDPGPFAQANPEGKFNRGNTPSRLPTVGRLPFDGGNGPDKVELILWAFEKEGHGVNARITAIANEGKPLARLGMASVRNQVKFDGLPARDGIVYGFQIGEHGPWSPLFCPKADSNPTTITVYWAAGGQTWLSDAGAFGDCWWLTVAAALHGWVTVDETVATYNALQPVIDWHGHRNLVFSLAQSRETGLGPRMQDAVIGLQARPWQGPVIPTTVPADFQHVVDAYRTAQTQ